MIAEYAALATRIRQTLLDLDRVAARAEALFQPFTAFSSARTDH